MSVTRLLPALLATLGAVVATRTAGEPARSVVEGRPAGTTVGAYAPDFQLEPVEVSADFRRWLGDKAPRKFEDRIMLSDFVGKAPIVLLFGSFT
jgi:hypothetical protein